MATPSARRASHPVSHPNESANSSTASPPLTSSRQPEDDGDLTWLDFIRSAGGTVHDVSRRRQHLRPHDLLPPPSNHSDSSLSLTPDRNVRARSFTEQGRRVNTVLSRPRIHTMDSGTPPADITDRRSFVNAAQTDLPPPKWQADIEVTKCPVCETEFSFWYRKHHCRKCGRVVCAACSPHRITIPKQYIVHPPNAERDYAAAAELGLVDSGSLEGGEVVRVCNPCVPDPWTPDPVNVATRSRQDSYQPPNRPLPSGTRVTHHDSSSVPDVNAIFTNQRISERLPDMLMPVPLPQPMRIDPGRQRSHSQRLPSVRFSQSVPHPSFAVPPNREGVVRPGPTGQPMPTHRGHRHAVSTSGFPRHMPGTALPVFASESRSSSLHPPPTAAAPRRRRIKEEDECPVCGRELPSGEARRETHIEECISSRFSGAQSSTPPAHGPDGAAPEDSGRARAVSFRSRGMAVYRATEKDCMNEDGETQECIICFEDFQPGDEMGRMECLCRFHRLCIRKWWETKGPGSCPTHQLQE